MGWTIRGSNPFGGEILRTSPDRPWGQPNLLYNGCRVFPGGKERPGRDAVPSPPSSAVVKKGESYTSTPPMDRTACTRVTFAFTFFTLSSLPTVRFSEQTFLCGFRQLSDGSQMLGNVQCEDNDMLVVR